MSLSRRVVLGGMLATPALHLARAAEPVTYLFPAPGMLPAFVPHQLAQARGYFAANGLAVTFQVGRGGADVAKQVGVGNVDLGGGVGETPIIVRANGLPVRGVALLGGRPIFQVAMRKSVGVKSLKDLKGKKIGVIGYQDSSYYSLLGVIAAEGLSRTDLQIESLGPAGITQLIIAGSVDGIMATPDWTDDITSAGVPLDLFPIDAVFPAMAQAILASDTTVQKKPAVIKGFVSAMLTSIRSCMEDPAKAAKDYCAFVPQQAGQDAKIERILRMYVTDVFPTKPPGDLGKFDPQRLATVEKFYVDNKIVETAVPIPDLYTNQFVA
jgi:NitT/TauT family transport system substrate-binding protein